MIHNFRGERLQLPPSSPPTFSGGSAIARSERKKKRFISRRSSDVCATNSHLIFANMLSRWVVLNVKTGAEMKADLKILLTKAVWPISFTQ